MNEIITLAMRARFLFYSFFKNFQMFPIQNMDHHHITSHIMKKRKTNFQNRIKMKMKMKPKNK
ncbi:hypothetical protein DERP_014844 [Dermatophagoides pteronyssinus]|uniref:Uncharacterized protein n=1 Tax=Dermatophagoides pteronyssinus TaxID=6956 RepID=A0ABQ8JAQ5_DERPT|nr:hypothetical protein DERP_014844 [Dermatophagoides pteronyssinus]